MGLYVGGSVLWARRMLSSLWGGAAVDGWGVFYGHPWVCPLRSGEQSWSDWEFGIRRANPSSVKSEISDSQTPGLFTDLS